MKRSIATLSVLIATMLPTTACFRGPGSAIANLAVAGLMTAAIISATAPPPPRVVVVPAPRAGYVWQQGYWQQEEGQWVWIDGQWVPENPGYQWVPAHWEEQPDGSWRFLPGQWVPLR